MYVGFLLLFVLLQKQYSNDGNGSVLCVCVCFVFRPIRVIRNCHMCTTCTMYYVLFADNCTKDNNNFTTASETKRNETKQTK